MRSRQLILVLTANLFFVSACSGPQATSTSNIGNSKGASPFASPTVSGESPSALAANAFKAQIFLVDPPTKLRTGEKVSLMVKIKNASDVMWWARGGPANTRADNKFYIAAGNRWLKPDGSLVTNMDGRYALPKDLKPGEEADVPLRITAPKDPGDYILEVDLVQEQVA
jgi:hypothetical protein